MEGLEEIFGLFASRDTQESVDVVAKPIFREVDCSGGVIQKSVSTLLKWRKVSLLISACNRMRLVMESTKAVDAEKAEQAWLSCFSRRDNIQTGTAVNLVLAEASQASLPDPLRWQTVEERPFQWTGIMPKFTHKCVRTPAGKLKIEFESVEPVEPGILDQVVSELCARVDSLPCLSERPVEGSQGPGLLNMIPRVAPAQSSDAVALLEHYLAETVGWSVDQQVMGLTNSPTISTGDEQGSNVSVDRWEFYPPVPELPGSQVLDSWVSMSENTSMWEPNDVMESVFCDQEQHDSSEYSDSPLKTMENDPRWKQLVLDAVTRQISNIYNEINQASDRSKLQNTQSEAHDCSVRLAKGFRIFEGELTRMLNDLRDTLGRISKSVHPVIEQQVRRAISQINLFNTREFKHLVREVGGITGKLERIAKELGKRDLSATKMFQNCNSSVAQLVESVLGMTSRFISVGDFNLYRSELYNLPRFRAGVEKGMKG